MRDVKLSYWNCDNLKSVSENFLAYSQHTRFMGDSFNPGHGWRKSIFYKYDSKSRWQKTANHGSISVKKNYCKIRIQIKMEENHNYSWLYLLASLLLLLLSNSFFFAYHCFLRNIILTLILNQNHIFKCRKIVNEGKDSIFDFLTMIIAIGFQTHSCINIYIVANYYM